MKILSYKSISVTTNWNLIRIVFFSSAAKYVFIFKYCSIFLSRNEILQILSKKGTENISNYDWPFKLSSGKQNFCFVKIGGHLFIFIKPHRKPPCGCLQTSFSSLVFHQIVGFSPKTSHVKNGLRAGRSSHDDNDENEKITKATGLISKAKDFESTVYWVLADFFSLIARLTLIEIAMWSSFHQQGI